MKPKKIKKILSDIIQFMSHNPADFVKRVDVDFTRNRKLSFETVLRMLIGMGGNNLCKELFEWFNYSESTASVSAFCQQRDKVSSSALEYIFKNMVAQCDEHVVFKGYRLMAVDGSDLRLPLNSNDENSFIRNDENTKGYNLLHLDAMYDLLQHIYVEASVQSKRGMNEHKALISMVDQSNVQGKVIVIADRGYESFNNIAHFQEKHWNYIIRSKESYGIKINLPTDKDFDIETIITLTRRQTKETKELMRIDPHRYRWIQQHTTFDYLHPRENKLYDIPIRVVRFKISENSYETLFTNLPADDFPAETLKLLYKMRWDIETSFRELKYNIGLASIHSKKYDLILQEIFSKLIMYNFSALIAYQIKMPPNKRINFSNAVNFCRQYYNGKITEKILLTLISKYLSSIRPDRIYKRFQNIKNAIGFVYRIS